MKTSALVSRTLAALLFLLLLSGCVAAIGNREPARSSATLGQQLMDLQKAREAGVITEAEYFAQRTKFLDAK